MYFGVHLMYMHVRTYGTHTAVAYTSPVRNHGIPLDQQACTQH
jgi:hypothetical protein